MKENISLLTGERKEVMLCCKDALVNLIVGSR